MKLQQLLIFEGIHPSSITAIARAVECQWARLRVSILDMMVVADVLAKVVFALEAIIPSVPVLISSQ
jgi:hypothetical protein